MLHVEFGKALRSIKRGQLMGRDMDCQKRWQFHKRPWGGVFGPTTRERRWPFWPSPILVHLLRRVPTLEGRGQHQTVLRDGSVTRPLPSNRRCTSCGGHPRSPSYYISLIIILYRLLLSFTRYFLLSTFGLLQYHGVRILARPFPVY